MPQRGRPAPGCRPAEGRPRRGRRAASGRGAASRLLRREQSHATTRSDRRRVLARMSVPASPPETWRRCGTRCRTTAAPACDPSANAVSCAASGWRSSAHARDDGRQKAPFTAPRADRGVARPCRSSSEGSTTGATYSRMGPTCSHRAGVASTRATTAARDTRQAPGTSSGCRSRRQPVAPPPHRKPDRDRRHQEDEDLLRDETARARQPRASPSRCRRWPVLPTR